MYDKKDDKYSIMSLMTKIHKTDETSRSKIYEGAVVLNWREALSSYSHINNSVCVLEKNQSMTYYTKGWIHCDDPSTNVLFTIL